MIQLVGDAHCQLLKLRVEELSDAATVNRAPDFGRVGCEQFVTMSAYYREGIANSMK